jgi:hypothetical protein
MIHHTDEGHVLGQSARKGRSISLYLWRIPLNQNRKVAPDGGVPMNIPCHQGVQFSSFRIEFFGSHPEIVFSACAGSNPQKLHPKHGFFLYLS